MSTASRYCGKAGGTCGGVGTQHPSPGATGGTRGHYDPCAARHSWRPWGTRDKRLPLARVPTRWNHLVEKHSRKINGLSMILSQKWFPLLRIML